MKRHFLATTSFLMLWFVSANAEGQTYRLRADAYAAAGASPTGMVFLQGEARKPSIFDSEAAIWVGSGETSADVLVMAIRARDPLGRAEARLGRMMISMGAIRPLHLDGADVLLRMPWGTSIEVFGGLPVTHGAAPRDYSWTVGGRAAQRFGQKECFIAVHGGVCVHFGNSPSGETRFRTSRRRDRARRVIPICIRCPVEGAKNTGIVIRAICHMMSGKTRPKLVPRAMRP